MNLDICSQWVHCQNDKRYVQKSTQLLNLQASHRVGQCFITPPTDTGLQETNNYDLIGNTTACYMIDSAQTNVTNDDSLSQNYKKKCV